MLRIVLIAILAVIVLVISSAIVGGVVFNNQVKHEVRKLLKSSQLEKDEVITEKDLEGLPVPVQKYLRYSQVIGKKRIRRVKLIQEGKIRTSKEQKWMPFEAVEHYTVSPPGFIWNAKAGPMNTLRVRDRYFNGKGNMLVKLLSLIKIVDETGKEMDKASLLRYFNEMMWFPTSLLGKNVTWEPIDSTSARGIFTDSGMTVSAVYHFTEDGKLKNFVAERYNDHYKKTLTWCTPITEYRKIGGFSLPVKGEAVWKLDNGEGDYSYIQLEIIDIEYN